MASRGTREHWDANVQAGRDGTRVHSDDKDVSAYALGQSQGGWGSKSSSTSGYSGGTPTFSTPTTGGSPGGLGALIFLPPLIPPLFILYGTWKYLDDVGWDLWPKIGAMAGALGIIAFFVKIFFRYIPVVIASLLTAIYMAITYAAAAIWMDFSTTWIGVAIVLTGTVGYWVGSGLSESYGNPNHKLLAEVGLLLLGGFLLLFGHQVVMRYSGSMSYSVERWADQEIPWVAIMLMVIGASALLSRFTWLLLITAIAGGGLWIEDPGIIQSMLARVF